MFCIIILIRISRIQFISILSSLMLKDLTQSANNAPMMGLILLLMLRIMIFCCLKWTPDRRAFLCSSKLLRKRLCLRDLLRMWVLLRFWGVWEVFSPLRITQIRKWILELNKNNREFNNKSRMISSIDSDNSKSRPEREKWKKFGKENYKRDKSRLRFCIKEVSGPIRYRNCLVWSVGLAGVRGVSGSWTNY